MAEEFETITGALQRLAKAVDRTSYADFPAVVDAVVALRENYRAMCDRLQAVTLELGLGLGGEHVDVLVVDELRCAVDENQRLRALLSIFARRRSIDVVNTTIDELEAQLLRAPRSEQLS